MLLPTLTLLSIFVAQVIAHSRTPPPLKQYTHPRTILLEVLPRHDLHLTKRHSQDLKSTVLRHDDSFRLILSAFNEEFYLHLKPNEELIHSSGAKVVSWNHGVKMVESLRREDVRVYEGVVVHPSHSEKRLREDSAGVHVHSMMAKHTLGWARIIVHEYGQEGRAPVFEGTFSVDGTLYHIHTKENYMRLKHPLDPHKPTLFPHPSSSTTSSSTTSSDIDVDEDLIIWRDSDVLPPPILTHHSAAHTPPKHTCAHDNLAYNTDPLQNPFLLFNSNSVLDRRDDVGGAGGGSTDFGSTIGLTTGCPKTQQILYMGVAADCKYVSQYGSKDNATRAILGGWNTASGLYKSTFNVSLGIIELQVQEPVCPSSAPTDTPWNVGCTVDLNDRLSIFSQWRGDKGNDNVGLWHLMSGCPTGTEVGIAWLATLCQQTATGKAPSIVSGTAVSTSGRTEWQVIAHEIGHNFGAVHDCAEGCNSTTTCCPLTTTSCNANSQFIMSPVAQPGEKLFSQCTIGNICSVMSGTRSSSTNTTCLISPSDATQKPLSLQMCGNGIVEPGEDCDPGSSTSSPCCNSKTCKFTSGAQCDPLSSDCCLESCVFAPKTRVCRPVKDGRCDKEEFCTGSSATCPRDVVSPNGESCGDGLACASGQCTSVAKQCQTVGASMGLKAACPNRGDQTCQISCQDPQRANQCVLLSTMLIDGSPCGYGGTCVSGKCRAGSALDTAKAWYTQNLQIAIPVTVVAGLFVIMILYCLIKSMFRCCRKRPDPAPVTFSAMRHERLGSYDRGDGPMPHMRSASNSNPSHTRGQSVTRPRPTHQQSRSHSHHHSRSRGNWVDESAYNGLAPR